MADETESGAPALKKTKLEIAKEAQAEVQTDINDKRVQLLERMIEHDSIGGQDQTLESLLQIVQKYPGGIPYPFLQSVFPEAALTKARDELKKAGKIEQIGKKGNVVLKPVAVA